MAKDLYEVLAGGGGIVATAEGVRPVSSGEAAWAGRMYTGPCTPVSASGRIEYDAGGACDVLVNLTPHPLVIVGLPGPRDARARAALDASKATEALVVPSHGVARLREQEMEPSDAAVVCSWVPDCFGGHAAPAVSYAEPEGDLPPALPNGQHYRVSAQPAEPGLWPRAEGPRVWFVVSLLTAMALRGRQDVLTTGPEIRDASGRILGCAGLRRVV